MEQPEAARMTCFSGRRPAVTVVIVTHNEGENLRRTVDGFRKSIAEGDEIVIVDDFSTDGSVDFLDDGYRDIRVIRPGRLLSVMSARNLGASVAAGDVIVHSDAHVDPSPGLLDPLIAALDDPEVGQVGPAIGVRDNPGHAPGYGYTWGNAGLQVKWLHRKGDAAYDVPIICSCCMAMRRDVYQATGGLDEGLTRWGSAEQELSLRLWLLGYRCRVVPESHAGHMFRKKFPYKVEWTGVIFNLLRMVTVHFSGPAAARVIAHFAKEPAFAKAWTLLAGSDTWARKAQMDALRHRSFDWFVNRFEIEAFV